MNRKIIFMGLGLFMGLGTLPQPVSAGFEFVAPKQNAAPAPRVSNPAWQAPQQVVPSSSPAPIVPPYSAIMPAPMAPALAALQMNSYQPPAVPPVPVAQQVLPQPRGVMPPQNNNITPSRSSGLMIDPYPLRNNKSARLNPSHQAVATTMAETGGALTPVQLGAGMTTGVKADQLRNNQSNSETRQPQRLLSDTSLTPIPGGEPAPLPNVQVGMEQAYYDPSYTQDKPLVYANAVGFARDVPMAIALDQIIPEGYSPRFIGSAGKDSIMVSWEGGESWNIVLNNMLRPHNLTAVIKGQTVTIQPMASL